MTPPTATPAERAALVRMVSATARLIVVIGRLIVDQGLNVEEPIEPAAEELVGAVADWFNLDKVPQAGDVADRESFQ